METKTRARAFGYFWPSKVPEEKAREVLRMGNYISKELTWFSQFSFLECFMFFLLFFWIKPKEPKNQDLAMLPRTGPTHTSLPNPPTAHVDKADFSFKRKIDLNNRPQVFNGRLTFSR